MSLNSAHVDNGVLLHAGEGIVLYSDNVTISFSGQPGDVFTGEKNGRLYLTTHRMVFNNKDRSNELKSFSFPFVALRCTELQQPIFGANYISGKVLAQPNGNFDGEAKYKLKFKSGGAIDFGKAMLQAAQLAQRNYVADAPPPYTPPSGPWYAAPPPAYSANPGGYSGWIPPTNVFTDQPAPNSVFMTDAPPPYPGITGYSGYTHAPNQSTLGAGGFTAPTSGHASSAADAKAAEAAGQVRTGYVDPNNPQVAYIPPGANELPPSYDESTKKNN